MRKKIIRVADCRRRKVPLWQFTIPIFIPFPETPKFTDIQDKVHKKRKNESPLSSSIPNLRGVGRLAGRNVRGVKKEQYYRVHEKLHRRAEKSAFPVDIAPAMIKLLVNISLGDERSVQKYVAGFFYFRNGFI